MKLTDKQKRFCEEYIIDLNATQAASRAEYSKKTAYSQGQRLLTNLNISQHIQKLQTEQSKRTQITADKVLSDVEDVRKRARNKDNFRAELKASELQGRHLGMFTDRIQHTTDMMSDEMAESIRKKLKERLKADSKKEA